MGKTFNTGYLQNIIQYDGSNNIILPSLIGTGTRIVVAAANGTLSSQTASTTNIAEGTNLYYTDTRVGTYLSTNTYATQSYVTTAIANLVDASPATLDTLNELAAALGDDPNFATTVATSIGTKQAQLNGTGFVKVSGTTVSYDNSTYLTTSSASSTYVPYTGASADLVLGANNFSSKRVSVLKSSDGYGGFTSNYLFLQTGSSTTNVGVDGISLLSKPNTRALVINYDIGGTNYGATLDAALLTGGRTFEFPNASGVLALTSNIPTNNNQLTNGAGYITSSALSSYLPLAGGTLTGPLAGTTSIFSSDFTQNETSKVGISFASGYGQINAWGANTSTYGGLKFQISVSNGNTVNALTLLPSGAATFISSVRAKGMSVDGTGGSGFLAQLDGNNSAANGAYLGFVNAANTRYFISQLDTNNDINYYYFNGSSWSSSLIKFSNIGAATFSSSVQIGTAITNYGTLQTFSGYTSPSLTVGTAAAAIFSCSAGQELALTMNGTAPYGINFQARNNTGGGPSGTSYPIIFNPLGGNVGIGTVPSYKLHVNGTNGSIAISGGGYTLNPIPMLIGQYTSTRGYIQVPDQGSIEMWNGGSSIIAEFKNNSNSIFYGSVGIGTATPLGKLSTIGGAVQIMGDYRNHQTIIKSAGTSGTLSGSLLITIPQMSDGNVDGYGGYSCEVYVAGYPGLFCHAWFSGYVNGGLTNSEATILRSSGGWSISQTSFGANNQGFQFTIDYPSSIVHPTARIIFNKGGSPNSAEYPANQITAVFS